MRDGKFIAELNLEISFQSQKVRDLEERLHLRERLVTLSDWERIALEKKLLRYLVRTFDAYREIYGFNQGEGK